MRQPEAFCHLFIIFQQRICQFQLHLPSSHCLFVSIAGYQRPAVRKGWKKEISWKMTPVERVSLKRKTGSSNTVLIHVPGFSLMWIMVDLALQKSLWTFQNAWSSLKILKTWINTEKVKYNFYPCQIFFQLTKESDFFLGHGLFW